ncbi:MAG: hypothetical protein JST76_07755 [Bacteroidetes bacterium]|nr:hypothetical protein [Bacteroidota bacterium]
MARECYECDGKGYTKHTCDVCNGSGYNRDAGYISFLSEATGIANSDPHQCSQCEGTGRMKVECSRCDGTGELDDD